MKKKWRKNIIYFTVAMLILLGVYTLSGPFEDESQKIPLSQVVEQVKDDKVEKIVQKDQELDITLKDGEKETAQVNKDESIISILKDYDVDLPKVKIEVEETSGNDIWINLLIGALPIIIIIAFFWFMMKQAQGGANQALSFGRSRPRLANLEKQKITFDDVAGVQEAKQELKEIVEFLRYPQKFTSIGAQIPKGVLLVGPPGSGKTLLARAVSGEAKVPFFSISGSEFVEMFVGVGASRVRDLFNKAKKNSPCILFIDEIDAVGRQRGAGLGGSHDEREQTLNQILVEMDGFETNVNVIVMAATNRPDVLDPALLRPGRFDRRVILDMPDIKDRTAILKVHVKNKPLSSNMNFEKIAQQTSGFSGADIKNLANEAAILAARRNKKKIGMQEFREAVEKVLLGPERKSRLLSKQEKKITAFHEAGHALVCKFLPYCDPVHKVSIVARGMAAGYTWNLPVEDVHIYSRSKFEDDLASMLAGRTAEKIIFNEITTGAENDLRKATKLARKMVTEFGMSEKLGPMTFGHKEELVFLGRELGERRNYSEEVAAKIDEEVRNIIEKALKTASDLLIKHKKKLKQVAEKLIDEETIEEEEFNKLFKEMKLPKKNNSVK